MFDWAKKATLATFAGHADTVYSVVLTRRRPAGRNRGGDGLIRIWNPAEDAKQEATLTGFQGPSSASALRRMVDILVAGSADRTVRVFNLKETETPPRLARTLEGHADWIQARWPSLPTAKPSPREVGTATSDSGDCPTASRPAPFSPLPVYPRSPAVKKSLDRLEYPQ